MAFTIIARGRAGMPVGSNWYINQKVPKIPLGVDVFSGELVWMRYPFLKGKNISDTVLVSGGTGSGKSVMAKLILWFISLKRPIIVFDWAGSDAYLMRLPNSMPVNLPPRTSPAGIKGHYLYYPCYASRQKMSYETIVRPNLTKYGQTQLEALGFSPGAAKYLRNVLHRYGPFHSLNTLYDFIEKFPINEGQSRFIIKQLRSGKISLKHNKWYKANDTILSNSKESIKKILPGLIEKKIFRLDNRQEFDFQKSFLAGENIIFSFNDKDVGRVEINYYMKQIEFMRKRYVFSPKYFVAMEEAHKVLARHLARKEEIMEIIEDFVLTCRKLGVGLILIMPEIIDLGGRVLNDIKNIITGKFKGENALILMRTIDDWRAQDIKHLKFNRFEGPSGSRELLFYNQDYGFVFRFVPYNSPCEIHRE